MPNDGEPVGRYYDEADPERLKAFVASIAWRAHHSSHYFFQPVNLGPYSDTIRDALLGAGDFEGIEVILSEFDKDDGSMLNPRPTRFDGINFWLFYTSRFTFYVKLDRRSVLPPLDAFV